MKIKLPDHFDWTFINDDILINISRPSLHDFLSQRLILHRVSDEITVYRLPYRMICDCICLKFINECPGWVQKPSGCFKQRSLGLRHPQRLVSLKPSIPSSKSQFLSITFTIGELLGYKARVPGRRQEIWKSRTVRPSCGGLVVSLFIFLVISELKFITSNYDVLYNNNNVFRKSVKSLFIMVSIIIDLYKSRS